MSDERPPPNYWATLISLGGLIVALISLLAGMNKSSAEDTGKIERRLCRLEALNNMGDCKR